jgi:hypothetical protein
MNDYQDTRTAAAAPPPAGAENGRRARGQLYKSPTLAGFLSLMPGLGQVYVGYYERGFAHAAIFAGTIGLLSAKIGIEPMLGPALGFFLIYNIIDAARRASLYNQALDGLSDMPLPDMAVHPIGGSIVGGVALIALACLLLARTVWDVDMDWMEDWWPAGLLLLGLWLLAKALRGRARGAAAPRPGAGA